MRFALRDKNADQLMLAHQAFVRLTYPSTGDEIVYVAEADSSNNYKFELVCHNLLTLLAVIDNV